MADFLKLFVVSLAVSIVATLILSIPTVKETIDSTAKSLEGVIR